jgi:hypothetical protein
MERLSCCARKRLFVLFLSFFFFFLFSPDALAWLEACLVYDIAELTVLSGDMSERGVGFCFVSKY